jgi:hypothetical protein
MARTRRCPCWGGSLRLTASSRAATATSPPPRSSARRASSVRSAATVSAGRSAAAARCQTLWSGRSASTCASAACPRRRSAGVAACCTAERISGCRNRKRSASSTPRPPATAGWKASGSTGVTIISSAARSRSPVSPLSSRDARSSRVRVPAGKRGSRAANAPSSRTVSGSTVSVGTVGAGTVGAGTVGAGTVGAGTAGRRRRAGVVVAGQRLGQLDEGERVARRLAQDLGAPAGRGSRPRRRGRRPAPAARAGPRFAVHRPGTGTPRRRGHARR